MLSILQGVNVGRGMAIGLSVVTLGGGGVAIYRDDGDVFGYPTGVSPDASSLSGTLIPPSSAGGYEKLGPTDRVDPRLRARQIAGAAIL